MSTHDAWHYILPNKQGAGTLCGEQLATEKQAKEWLARQHHCKPEEINVKRAGEEDVLL